MVDPANPVRIVDIDVPFGRLVAFMVKASLAAIPAAIIVSIVLWIVWFVILATFGLSLRPFRV